jgi:hypothetical protein
MPGTAGCQIKMLIYIYLHYIIKSDSVATVKTGHAPKQCRSALDLAIARGSAETFLPIIRPPAEANAPRKRVGPRRTGKRPP